MVDDNELLERRHEVRNYFHSMSIMEIVDT